MTLCGGLVAASVMAGENRWTRSGPADFVFNLAADPNGPALYGAGATSLWRSVDHGESWESLGVMPDGNPPFALAVDPHDSARLIAGAPHLYRSADEGARWTDITPPTYNGLVYPESLIFDPGVPDRVYVSSDGDLFRSDDLGSSWTRLGSDALNVGLVAVDPHDPSRLYFSDENEARIFESRDTGASWTEVSTVGYGHQLIGLTFGGDGFRYLIGAPHGNGRIYRSLDRGRSWSGVFPPLGGLPLSLAVDPKSPNRIYVTEGSQPSPGGIPPPPWYEVVASRNDGVSYGPLTAGLDRYTYLPRIVADSSGTYLHASDQSTGTWTYHIAGGATLATLPTLSPPALALLAALIAAAGLVLLRRL